MLRRSALLAVLFASLTIATAAQTPKHFFWSVKDANGSEAFLVGSLHVLTKDFYPLSPEIEKAFESSRALVEEVDLDELNNPTSIAALVSKAMFTDGRTLEQAVSPTTFAEVKRRAEKVGIPLIALQRMKPWMAAVALTTPMLTAAGFDTDLGVDRHFFTKAKDLGRQRWALETVSFQLDRFDQLSPALQEQMLTSTLADVDTQIANVKEVAAAWATGDTKTIERVLVDGAARTARALPAAAGRAESQLDAANRKLPESKLRLLHRRRRRPPGRG